MPGPIDSERPKAWRPLGDKSPLLLHAFCCDHEDISVIGVTGRVSISGKVIRIDPAEPAADD